MPSGVQSFIRRRLPTSSRSKTASSSSWRAGAAGPAKSASVSEGAIRAAASTACWATCWRPRSSASRLTTQKIATHASAREMAL